MRDIMMSEALEQAEVPQSYGVVAQEYEAVRDGGAGLIDLTSRGRLLVGGSEAVQFLNGLITNDMKTLTENSWMPAAFPNVQGRLIASVRVMRMTGDNYLIDTEVATHQPVMKMLERFTLAGDFIVSDITNKTTQFTLQGKRSRELVRALVGEPASTLPARGVTETTWQDVKVTLARASHTGEDGFDFIVDSQQRENLRNALINSGAQPVGEATLEVLRIEAGIARYGVDVDETNVVTEGNFDDAVSYTKGCYIGQEIIARIKYRGHVAKKLTGLKFEGTAQVAAGAAVSSIDGKEIGRVTSVAFSPALARTVALALIKYDFLTAGTKVRVGDMDAEITQLPFVGTSVAD